MQIFYFFDPLCGWCYGFSPAIAEVYSQWQDKATFRVIAGGMVRGERSGPISNVSAYLKKAYPDVEARCGVQFGAGFLKQLEVGTLWMDSLPPSRALAVYREMGSQHELRYAAHLQHAIYSEGHEPNDLQGWAERAEQFGLKHGHTAADFLAQLEDPSSLEKAEAGFYESQQFGVQGFPSVVVHSADQYYLIARGYRPASELFPILDELAAKEA